MLPTPHKSTFATRHQNLLAGALFLLWFTLSGCFNAPQSASEPQSTALQAPQPAITPVADPPRAVLLQPDYAPMADWTEAANLHDFHEIWRDRFALTTSIPHPSGGLVPHADAVTVNGAVWGIAPEEIHVAFPRGNVLYTARGVEHSALDLRATPAADSNLTALFDEIRQSRQIQYHLSGVRLQLAGPLLADASCQSCHTYTPDAVVGMLIYRFFEIPDD